MDNTALFLLSYGVYAVTTKDVKDTGSGFAGCIANSAMQVTSSPARIAVAINVDNYTNGCIKACRRFALNVIAEGTPPIIIGTFGFRSGRNTDKLESISYAEIDGLPVLAEAAGCVICDVVETHELGTHTIFIGEITNALRQGDKTPMTYEYYHRVIKGKSPKNAPTYVAPEST